MRGSCPQCQAGKYRHPPKPSSTSPPAQSPSEVISFDPNKLPVPAVGGYTHFLLCVDEKTGFLNVLGCLSKSTAHLFEALHQLIRVYNAHQHRVIKLHGDCESVNLSLIPHLGSIGVTLVSSPPADHAQRVERSNLSLNNVCTAMLADLLYILPKMFILNLLQAGAASRNSLVTPRTSPYTPNDLVLHTPPQNIPFPFLSHATFPMLHGSIAR
jgi:hypothetical protein